MRYIREDGTFIVFKSILCDDEPTIFRHFKGQEYQIVTIATDSESREDIVVYQALYGDLGYYTRPAKMFFSLVDKDKYPEVTQKYRFEALR